MFFFFEGIGKELKVFYQKCFLLININYIYLGLFFVGILFIINFFEFVFCVHIIIHFIEYLKIRGFTVYSR